MYMLTLIYWMDINQLVKQNLKYTQIFKTKSFKNNKHIILNIIVILNLNGLPN